MTRALAGHASASFDAPEGVTFAEIDPDTGLLAAPGCPKTLTEAFMPGTAPTSSCPLHGIY
jgi:membrane carboxypeptidase/penicillin-binding protein